MLKIRGLGGLGFEDQNIPRKTTRTLPFTRPCRRCAAGKNLILKRPYHARLPLKKAFARRQIRHLHPHVAILSKSEVNQT